MSLIPSLQDEAANNTAGYFYLSGETLAVFRLAYDYLISDDTWKSEAWEALTASDRDEIDRMVDNAMREISEEAVLPAIYPQTISIPGTAFKVSGVALDGNSFLGAGGQLDGGIYVLLFPTTEEYSATFVCDAGDYFFRVWGNSFNQGIIAEWYFDGVLWAAGQNWNSVSSTANVLRTFGAVRLEAGRHVVTVKRQATSGATSRTLRISRLEGSQQSISTEIEP